MTVHEVEVKVGPRTVETVVTSGGSVHADVTVGPRVVEVIALAQLGRPGPPGQPGATGEPGADGVGAGNISYVHTQGSTSDTWVIDHNLGYFPSITVVDSGGTVVEGEVTHNSVNQATVHFANAFSGMVYAS